MLRTPPTLDGKSEEKNQGHLVRNVLYECVLPYFAEWDETKQKALEGLVEKTWSSKPSDKS